MTPLLVLAAALAAQDAGPRFAGKAALEPPEPVSIDRRFELHAELGTGDSTQRAGRFAVDARLDAGASAKAALVTTACGPPNEGIFDDSFEATPP